MPIQAVLFDIDGTLVDSNEQHVDAWAFAFRAEGHPQEREAIRSLIGKGGDLLVPSLLPDLDARKSKRITETHGENFKTLYLDRVRPFRHATDLLRATKASGRKVVLASSAKRAELDHYLELLDAAEIVDASTSIDDVEVSKPAPDIFEAALRAIKVRPEDAIVIGDTLYDVEAATRAGIDAIGLTSGPFDEKQLREAGAIAVFADVGALLAQWKYSPLRD